jgi:peptidoglycan/LPS O-acetylase OafA/YrhL
MSDLLTAGDNTIGARLKVRENNFDFLRLFAAFAVIFSHAYPIRDGVSDFEPYWRISGYCTFGEISVAVFFVISGLLVARSFLADPSATSFLRKRLLRILPGLIACVAFCIFIVGPLFTQLKLREFFLSRETLKFARNALLLPASFHLPGIFENFDIWDPRKAVNGSLWSLPLEFLMYLAVLGLGMAKVLKKKTVVTAVAVLFLMDWLYFQHVGFEPTHPFLQKYRVWFEQMPHLAALFIGGTLMLLFQDVIVLSWRWLAVCVLSIALTWQVSLEWAVRVLGGHGMIRPIAVHPVYGYLVFSICLPYIVMYLAFVRVRVLKPVLQSVTKWGDFSYGVYLYGYPVEQMLFRTWGDKLPFPLFIGLSCIGTLFLAILSWHLVEKPFLKLKKRTTHVGPEGSGPNHKPLPDPSVKEEARMTVPPAAMQRQQTVMR